jgi:hypothetical protein
MSQKQKNKGPAGEEQAHGKETEYVERENYT